MPSGSNVVSRNYDEHAHWEVLNALIGRIYECALDPNLWNETLAQITSALCPLNWESAFLLWESSNPPRAQFVAASGLAAGVQEMYTAVYAGDNPWSRRIMPYRNGSVIDTDEILSREEFLESKLARDFLVPWGINRMVAVMLDRRGGQRLGLILPGPGERDLDELKRGMRVLAPHIQRAIRISHRIASLELAAGAAIEATDQSPFAVLSLDANLGILTSNRRVGRFEEAGVISTFGQRLAFSDPSAQKKLVQISKALPPAGSAFQATSRSGRELPVLAARIAPQRAQLLGGLATGAAVIITIGSAPGETPVVEINRVAQWFGLTPAEARLAVAISDGTSLQDYAAERAVTINAIRFLLKGVFRKTAVTSQAQLAAIIARLPTGSVNSGTD
jgi:DNA-binding CsgD family transcriptional regulator